MAKKKLTIEDVLVPKEEIPYEVPKNWCWTRLGIVGEYINGKAFKSTEWKKTGIPIVRIQNLTGSNSTFNYSDGNVDEKYFINNGDLLIAWSATLGAFIWDGGRAVLNQHIFKVKPKINKKYLFYLVNHSIDELYRRTQGTGMVHVTKKVFDNIEIPLPPLAEQERIVNRIENLFEKVDKASELIEEAREGFEKRRAAILEKAFNGELTKSWRKEKIQSIEKKGEILLKIKEQRLCLSKSGSEKKKIEEEYSKIFEQELNNSNIWINLNVKLVCDTITKGATPSKHISEQGNIPFLKVYNIVNNEIDFNYKPQFISEEAHNGVLKRSRLYPNDVVMNIVGPPLRKIAIIPDEYDEWNINQAIAIFRPIEYVLPKFIYYWLQDDNTLKNILEETRGVVGQSNISLEQCRDLSICVPSIEEQHEIVRILERLLGNEKSINDITHLNIDNIKKSILAKAFRAELGSNDLNEESSIALLKEIMK